MAHRSTNAEWGLTAFLVLIAFLCCVGSCRGDHLLTFTATWCGPCQAMKPEVDRAFREGVDIRVVDIDKNPELARKYGVRCVPTTIYVHDSSPFRGESVLGVIEGKATCGQLKRLAFVPGVTTVGAASRNAIRFALGGVGGVLEW